MECLFDHIVAALRVGLRDTLGLDDDRALVGWPGPGQGPDAGPLPCVAVSFVSSEITMRPSRLWSVVEAGGKTELTDDVVAQYLVGRVAADLQVDIWCPSKTSRAALGGAALDYLMGSPSRGRTGRTLSLAARYGESVRFLAGAPSYDNDDGAGPRMLIPVEARAPYLIEETLRRLRTLVIEFRADPTSLLPDILPGTTVIF